MSIKESRICASYKDSASTQPDNRPDNFIIQLPAEINCIQTGKMALLEAEIAGLSASLAQVLKAVYILCDSVDSSTFVGKTQLPALRRLTLES